LQYRTTPHSTTGVPPAELLFNRTVKGKLPVLRKRNIINRHRQARQNEESKENNNKYADNKRNVKKSDIKVGDRVLVKQQKQNLHHNTTKYRILQQTDNTHVLQHATNTNILLRETYVSHFKPLQTNNKVDTDDEDDDSIDSIDNNDNGQKKANHTDSGNNEPSIRKSSRNTYRPERYGQPLLW
jgi:hypothetical protein